jgi:hypothetical protein
METPQSGYLWQKILVEVQFKRRKELTGMEEIESIGSFLH